MAVPFRSCTGGRTCPNRHIGRMTKDPHTHARATPCSRTGMSFGRMCGVSEGCREPVAVRRTSLTRRYFPTFLIGSGVCKWSEASALCRKCTCGLAPPFIRGWSTQVGARHKSIPNVISSTYRDVEDIPQVFT